MGREAIAYVEVGGEAGEVKVLLEACDLILRGAIRRRYAKTDIHDLQVVDGVLRFDSGAEAVALHLGSASAAVRWAEAIRKPLPTLREKLDLKGNALVLGACDDPALVSALADARTDRSDAASVIVVQVAGPGDLEAALAVPGPLPIWAVYPKGTSAFGDAAIRTRLRAAGYRDTKSCAVSKNLTATRYHPPR